MPKLKENKIIIGCQAQDPFFQKELVLCYAPVLLTVARRYCWDRAGAKDILQDSFLKILRAMPTYRPSGSFVGWMKKIVINTALHRKTGKRYELEKPGLDLALELPTAPEIYSQLGAEELMKIIETLPDGFRTIFNLYAIEGYSHQEIGELLNITASTSRSQLSRARKLLQDQLNRHHKISIGHGHK